ncbi:SHSP domain-containing protein [Citrus sinensis]|uniref:SHSP domain-containing protein n=1 Tax=Citrus clementina TaxID=85681 RepID=V4UZ06_CITCL|nr:hypothetical protein CICLE_v10003506mg [Citrus x clementina]KAH9684407.1 SHSP domain-containing protein [Citrus sinensis]
MAKSRILAMTMLFLVVAATLMNMASQANALMPYTRSPFFDMMFRMTEEPFRRTTTHVITLDILGMKKDDVKIERKADDYYKERVEGERWHRAKRPFGKFWRQFRMTMMPKLAEEMKRQPKAINVDEESGNSSNEDIKPTKAQM